MRECNEEKETKFVIAHFSTPLFTFFSMSFYDILELPV